MPAKSATAGGFDARLFNQSQGMDSGFKGEDSYDVYDKAFRGEKATSIYRPTKRSDALYTDEEVSPRVHPSFFFFFFFFFFFLLLLLLLLLSLSLSTSFPLFRLQMYACFNNHFSRVLLH